jgi:hypothetical protein
MVVPLGVLLPEKVVREVAIAVNKIVAIRKPSALPIFVLHASISVPEESEGRGERLKRRDSFHCGDGQETAASLHGPQTVSGFELVD